MRLPAKKDAVTKNLVLRGQDFDKLVFDLILKGLFHEARIIFMSNDVPLD